MVVRALWLVSARQVSPRAVGPRANLEGTNQLLGPNHHVLTILGLDLTRAMPEAS